MDDMTEFLCPYCDLYFSLTLRFDGLNQPMEYCPRCGSEMEYDACIVDSEIEDKDEQSLRGYKRETGELEE